MMPESNVPHLSDFKLPRRQVLQGDTFIAGSSYASFTSRFGHAFPKPTLIESDLGVTALYDLAPPSGRSRRPVLIVHGLNTPALGMLALAKELQKLDPDAHVVLFDLWGHGLSSTPLVAHTPHIFHLQIFQVLSFMKWVSAHIIGFSFGGATAVSFVGQNPQAALSAAIVAPAGLLRVEDFDQGMQDLLVNSTGREEEAMDTVLTWLEGGPLVVPTDWQDKVKSGQIVAEALREWNLQDHSGYRQSVLSMFQDGGVCGADGSFRRFAKLPVKSIAVLAELDDVCSKEQLVELGFQRVEVVGQATHSFVRSHYSDVARIVHRFWEQVV